MGLRTRFPASLKRLVGTAIALCAITTFPAYAATYNGTWQLTPENSTGLRLDVAGNGTANGTLLNAYTSNGTGAQSFTFSNVGVVPAGDYNFTKTGGSYCVQPTGTASGSTVEIWACAGTAAQAWNVVADTSPAGYYHLSPSSATATCLNNTGTTSGSSVTIATCNSGTGQQWSGLTGSTGSAPAAPAGLTATAGNAQVSLSWTATSGATSYSVYRGTTAGGESATAIASGITGTTYNNTGLSNGTKYYYKVAAVNSFGTSGQSNETSATPASGGTSEAPYLGTPWAIPGTVQAENYDTGGQGVGYSIGTNSGTGNSYRSDGVDLETTTDTGGGYDVGWTAAGQWFRYTVNVQTAGVYTVSLRVAADTAVTNGLHISNSSGTNLSGEVSMPSTGGWQTWETVTATVTLPAGQQVLTVNQDTGGWNFNWFSVASGGGTLTSAPIPNGTYTATPQNATGLRLDDSAASTATGNPIDVYTSNGTAAQNWALSDTGVVPAGYFNLSTEGAYCLTASSASNGSAAVLEPCAGSSAQAWAAVASGSNYIFHPANNTALCLTASGTTAGNAADVDTCSGGSNQVWALGTGSSGGGGTPGKIFAPFEYVGDLGNANQIAGIVSASGAKGVILAFLVPSGSGCNLEWPGANGVLPNDSVGGTSMATAIASLQASGVTVAISQGGAGGQEAAAYCSSASATQAVYQQLITKYNVKWLDFDIEYGETSGQSVRRAQALAALQAANPGLMVSYTLPADTGGLNSGTGGGETDVTDAKAAGVNLTYIDAMAMDFGNESTDQATLAEETGSAVESWIQSEGLSSKVGITVLPGTSDDSGAVQFQLSDATTLLNWANANSYVAMLSFWELNRDNGGCPGSTVDEDTCSGVSQSNYQFSSIFDAY